MQKCETRRSSKLQYEVVILINDINVAIQTLLYIAAEFIEKGLL